MSETRYYCIPDPAAIAAKVKAAGGPCIDLTQPSGRATADGVTLSWTLGAGQVAVEIVSKPWIATYGAIWSHVESVLGRPVA